MKRLVSMLLVATAFACGKSEPPAPTPAPVVTAEPAPPAVPEAAAPAKPAQHVELAIASVGEQMAFDKTTLTVPAGAEVHLVFKNNSKSTTMMHNWALVKVGTEAKVAEKGLMCSGRGAYRCPSGANYVDTSDTDLLAFTPQAKAGETTEVTFTAPDAGKYPYICTFPGHYMMMKGTLVVTP